MILQIKETQECTTVIVQENGTRTVNYDPPSYTPGEVIPTIIMPDGLQILNPYGIKY